MTKQPEQFFTLEEANGLVPAVEKQVARLIEKQETYRRMHDHLFMHELISVSEKQQGVDPEGSDLDGEARALEEAICDLEKDIFEIRKLGCSLHDLERGWVDFPARCGDEVISFCWGHGDDSIRFFHGRDANRSERCPINAWPA